MLASIFSPRNWSSNREPSAEREQFVWLTRRYYRWTGQLVLWGMLVAGAGWLGASILPPPEPDMSGPPVTHRGPVEVVEGVAFSPDGRTLAACGCDNAVSIWDVSRLGDGSAATPVLLPHETARYAVAFSPDNSLLATVGAGSVAIWSCTAGQYEVLLEEECEACRCVAFSPDGHTLALGTDNGSIRLWDLPDCRERAVVPAHGSVVRSLAFSPDSRRLVSSGQDRSIMLIDAIDGVAIRPLELERLAHNPVLFVAFSPVGHTVAVGEVGVNPENVLLLDSETGEVVSCLAGHQTGVHALAFSPDGRTLATAGIDSSIKLWDISNGKELTTLQSSVSLVKSLAFSRDGAWLAFGAGKDTVQIWDVARSRSFLLGRLQGRVEHGPTTTLNRSNHPPEKPDSHPETFRLSFSLRPVMAKVGGSVQCASWSSVICTASST